MSLSMSHFCRSGSRVFNHLLWATNDGEKDLSGKMLYLSHSIMVIMFMQVEGLSLEDIEVNLKSFQLRPSRQCGLHPCMHIIYRNPSANRIFWMVEEPWDLISENSLIWIAFVYSSLILFELYQDQCLFKKNAVQTLSSLTHVFLPVSFVFFCFCIS